MSDRVLVTGAGGYLGRHVVAALREEGVEAAGVTRADCDLAVGASVDRLLDAVRPSSVVHAAAWIGGGSATPETVRRALDDNVAATANVVSACCTAGVARLIFCSSVEVYAAEPHDGRAHREDDSLLPPSLYGRTKAAGELTVGALEGSATQPTILRMPGLHGGDRASGVVYRFLKAAEYGEPVDLPEPGTRLSFLWVSDAARIVVAAALGQLVSAPRVLNVASGQVSLHELALASGKVTGRRLEVRLGTGRSRNRVLDLTRMNASLPFRLPPFEEGLRTAQAVHSR